MTDVYDVKYIYMSQKGPVVVKGVLDFVRIENITITNGLDNFNEHSNLSLMDQSTGDF